MLEKSPSVLLLDGRSVQVRSWPLRPGLRHLASVRNIELDPEKIEESHVATLVELAVDGSNLTRDEIEKIAPADFLVLCKAVIEFNVRPLSGLREQPKKK